MIPLLFTVVAVEVAVVVLLLIKTPFRKLAVLVVDRVKRGKGPVVAWTVVATVSALLVSSVHSMVKIGRKSGEGTVAADQIMWTRHLLEASLLGFSLFLLLIIGRLHHYVRELRALRKSTKDIMKQKKILEEEKSVESEEIKAREREIESLKSRITDMELESEYKVNEVKIAEASTQALLRKQSEGFLLEYDRLLEDNQNLRSQLLTFDRKLSRSDSRRNW